MSIGVIVNILTVVIGGIFGAVAGKWLSRDFADRLTLVFGVCAMGMGISSINQMENMPAVILALVAGACVGMACRLGFWIQRGGAWMQKPITRLMGDKSKNGLSQEESLSLCW